jgi:hypothetical protein
MKAQAINARAIDRNTARSQGARLPGGSLTLATGLLAQARALELLARLATRLAIALLPAVAIVALAALAWLSMQAAPELAVAAATLVAARLAVAIFRRT